MNNTIKCIDRIAHDMASSFGALQSFVRKLGADEVIVSTADNLLNLRETLRLLAKNSCDGEEANAIEAAKNLATEMTNFNVKKQRSNFLQLKRRLLNAYRVLWTESASVFLR